MYSFKSYQQSFDDHFFSGIAGAGILYAVTPEKLRGKLGANVVHDDVTAGQAVGVEAMLTFIVVLTACSATDTERKINDYGLGPLVIGLVYSAAHFMGVSESYFKYVHWISLSVLI